MTGQGEVLSPTVWSFFCAVLFTTPGSGKTICLDLKNEENQDVTMKDQTLGAPCYKTKSSKCHAAHMVKIEWVISHFDGAMAQGAVLTETLEPNYQNSRASTSRFNWNLRLYRTQV